METALVQILVGSNYSNENFEGRSGEGSMRTAFGHGLVGPKASG